MKSLSSKIATQSSSSSSIIRLHVASAKQQGRSAERTVDAAVLHPSIGLKSP
jgi:hypothetical protein